MKLAQYADALPEVDTSNRVDEDEDEHDALDGPTFPVELDPEALEMLREGVRPVPARVKEEEPPLEGSLRARRAQQRTP